MQKNNQLKTGTSICDYPRVSTLENIGTIQPEEGDSHPFS